MWQTFWSRLVDKICKYEIYLAGIVENVERTRFGPETDGRRDGQCRQYDDPYAFMLVYTVINRYTN